MGFPALVLLVFALVLTACGGNGSSDPGSPAFGYSCDKWAGLDAGAEDAAVKAIAPKGASPEYLRQLRVQINTVCDQQGGRAYEPANKALEAMKGVAVNVTTGSGTPASTTTPPPTTTGAAAPTETPATGVASGCPADRYVDNKCWPECNDSLGNNEVYPCAWGAELYYEPVETPDEGIG
jgi:hypothetical protein